MSSDSRPNIILITTDQQRYDTLGVNGSECVRTPNLDALAKHGIVFGNAITQSPVCIPSQWLVLTLHQVLEKPANQHHLSPLFREIRASIYGQN